MNAARQLIQRVKELGGELMVDREGLALVPGDLALPHDVEALIEALAADLQAELAKPTRPPLRALQGGVEADSTGREWYAQPVPTSPRELASRNAETAQRYIDHMTRRLGLAAPSATVKAQQPERWARIVAAELAWDSALPSVRTLGDVEHVNGWLVTWVKEWEGALEELGKGGDA